MGEDFSKIEDFSEPTRNPIRGTKAGIFWDVDRYPFPVGSTPDFIYKKVESAIRDEEFSGELSIWAYVDEQGPWGEFLSKKKTWESRIYFLPGGDKRVKRDRMFHDVLLWKMDSPYATSSFVVVVSDEVRDDKLFFFKLENMSVWHYNVILIESTKDVPSPDSLEWPALLFDQAFNFNEQREEEEERSRKKSKAVAEEGSQDQA